MDHHQTPESLVASINDMMNLLPQSSSHTSTFERARKLPDVNNQLFSAHEPKLVAFGFSHCRPNPDMTKNKVVYLKQLVERGGQRNKDYVKEFVTAIKELEDKVYKCYDESDRQHVCRQDFEVEKDKYSPRSPLVKIIFDACFILELVYKWSNASFREPNDPIFLQGENLQIIIRDMFVLSNQVPLFLLQRFFEITAEGHGSFSSFTDMVIPFIEKECCISPINIDKENMKDAKHLLAFAYDIWVNSSGRTTNVTVEGRSGRQRVIRNATELRRAGVRFRSVKEPTFDVKFEHGVLKIPVLSITTETECFLQNIIAYEQSFQNDKKLVVGDYCVFMDCLIQSPQDVQLLCENGVIESYLHDDKDIVSLFDRLGKRVPSSTHFCYSKQFDDLNDHCVRTWNSCKAKFKRDYLRDDNQLDVVSLLIALAIIIPVTVLQTLYTVLSYYAGSGKGK